jgi:hypothetical protein
MNIRQMIVKENVNGYNEAQYKIDFGNHKCSKVIEKDVLFDRVKLRFDLFFYFNELYHPSMDNILTPRLGALQSRSTFSIAPLYYLDFLLEKNPQVIVDIGCGANLFKRIIPCIHGIDPTPNNPYADEFGSFDSEFSQSHKDTYESVFSINAIHFISLINFEQKLLEFINVVKPGGRGFITFNAARMIELTSEDEQRQLFSQSFSPDTINPKTTVDYTIHYVRHVLHRVTQNTLVKFLVIDLLIDKELDEYMNGNIRLVFEK